MRVLTKMGVLKALTAAIALLAISFLGHPAQAQPACQEISAVPGIIYGQPSTTCYAAEVDSNHALKTTGTFTPSGTGDVNIKQVNGATVNVGAGAASTGTQRVITSTDSTIGTVTAVTTVTNPVGIKGADGSTISSASNPVPAVINPSATIGVTTQSCTAACASTLVSGAHSAYGISGSATVSGWILVYDAVACSANGTVTPKKAFAYTVANSTIGVSWADVPMVNATGIAVCFSSTGPYTATASTTAFLSVDYK
jgi:hypothetical protein